MQATLIPFGRFTPGRRAMLLLAEVLAAIALLSFGAHAAELPQELFIADPTASCVSADNPSHWTCDPVAVAHSLRELSKYRPTDDSGERYFLNLCASAVSAMLSVRTQVLADNDELASLRRDHPNEDERREILRAFERAERHAEAYLDGMRSMADSWCPNISGFRGAIPESERDMKQIKETIDSMRRTVPGATDDLNGGNEKCRLLSGSAC